MQRTKINTIKTRIGYTNTLLKVMHLSLILLIFNSCDDFVGVELPKNQLTSQAVFEDVSTATAALMDIYAKMRDGGLLAASGLSFSMGTYTDELIPANGGVFFNHTLSAVNAPSNLWTDTYNILYATNAVIEGVDGSSTILEEDKRQLIGEALFVRGYMHFLLTELWGDVPYITTTNYVENTTASRTSVSDIYVYLIDDLLKASEFLGDDVLVDPDDEDVKRIRLHKKVVEALLARVYLYTEQWGPAEAMATRVIDAFTLEQDITKVFLNTSRSTIWQFKPVVKGVNTSEGALFVFEGTPSTQPVLTVSLAEDAFEANDKRAEVWVRKFVDGSNTFYHAFKYKEQTNTDPKSLEYSIVFRLAEQYLIRAEARAELGEILLAQQDLNAIRNRAGLPNTTAATIEAFRNAVLKERRAELFTEHGHRWFDLKRMGKASEVLSPIKSNWQDNHILLPIPESEILLNPKLTQNSGY